MNQLNVNELRAALARRGQHQWQLAASLGVSPSSFSAYLSGARVKPADFIERVERALSLPPGSLTARTASD